MARKSNPVNNFNVSEKLMELVEYMEKFRPDEKIKISKEGFNFQPINFNKDNKENK